MKHGDVTGLLSAVSEGQDGALDAVVPLVYDQLRRIAHARLRGERAGHTLGTTALVHEAYLRLVQINDVRWENRAHFLSMSSRVMRRVLVDYAKRRNAAKREAGRNAVSFDEELVLPEGCSELILGLDEALTRLSSMSPRQAQIVEMRYFAGYTLEEVADALGLSPATVKRDWTAARAWLCRELDSDA